MQKLTAEMISLISSLRKVKEISIWQMLTIESGIKQYGSTITIIEKLKRKKNI